MHARVAVNDNMQLGHCIPVGLAKGRRFQILRGQHAVLRMCAAQIVFNMRNVYIYSTLIQAVFQALLVSALSEPCLRIHALRKGTREKAASHIEDICIHSCESIILSNRCRQHVTVRLTWK